MAILNAIKISRHTLLVLVVFFTVVHILFLLFASKHKHAESAKEASILKFAAETTQKNRAILSIPQLITTLPSLNHDRSEFILSSVIERQFDTFSLHATTFFMSHHILDSSEGDELVEQVHPDVSNMWKSVSKSFKRSGKYYPSGKRKSRQSFSCRIQHSQYDKPYKVLGSFLPNRLTSDSNSNRRLDVLRCPLSDSKSAALTYFNSSELLYIEILRGHESLINFTIPWRDRRTGYLISTDGFLSSPLSNIDAWTGLTNPVSKPIVHLCVPGTHIRPTRENLPILLEFVSHHYLIGFDHIYLSIALSSDSDNMDIYTTLFRSYIREKRLTLIPQSGDGYDGIQSIGGLKLSKFVIKVMQASMVLFFAKGVADYVAVFDIDEFFIPKWKHATIQDVIRSADPHFGDVSINLDTTRVDAETWKGGPGLADGDAHPLCYISIPAEVVGKRDVRQTLVDENPWMGVVFSHGAEPWNSTDRARVRYAYSKAILPTRTIYQAGINNGGACRLDWKWTPCAKEEHGKSNNRNHGFCGDATDDPRRRGTLGPDRKRETFFTDHRFDELVTNEDAKVLNIDFEGSLYHFMRFKQNAYASSAALSRPSNDYASRFFPKVLEDLSSRGLDLILRIPGQENNRFAENALQSWSRLFSASEAEALRSENQQDEVAKSKITIEFLKLKKNYNDRSEVREVSLPDFAVNYTEFALSAMIERESDSYRLYITTFFLCHWLLEPKEGGSAASGEKISPEAEMAWKQAMINFERTLYHENGARVEPPGFFCRIRNSDDDSKAYTVRGVFVPNRLTPDSNSNRRLDILRCKMHDTKYAYNHLIRSTTSVIVEILRDQEVILKYRIPWKTRYTGISFETPSVSPGEDPFSTFDPWKGFNPNPPPHQLSSSTSRASPWSHDLLYMCVPGLDTPPSKITLPLYLEYVQHHLLQGAQHIFLGALFDWESPHMKLLQRVLTSYIMEDRVSLYSTSNDGYDMVYSTGGLSWGRDNVKNFFVNICTYYSKGVAEYVAVWDLDEFFIPQGSIQDMGDLIRTLDFPPEAIPPPSSNLFQFMSSMSNEELRANWRGGRGLADGEAHPLCYLVLESEVTLFPRAYEGLDTTRLWIGQRFSHGFDKDRNGLGFQKSIRPTRKIYQGGLHVPGACRLPQPWTDCSISPNGEDANDEVGQLCMKQEGKIYRLYKLPNGTSVNFHRNHRFDEVIISNDGKAVNPRSEAYINHIQFHRFWFGADKEARTTVSDYTRHHFPSVMQVLQQKHLVDPVDLPGKAQKPYPEVDSEWTPLTEIHRQVMQQNVDNLGEGESLYRKGTHIVFPEFADDQSEFILASLIERTSSEDLYLTTFFLNHELLDPLPSGVAALRVENTSASRWMEAMKIFLGPDSVQYYPNGRRKDDFPMTCELRNRDGGAVYLVPGYFVANSITGDSNANRRIDILRCRMSEVASVDQSNQESASMRKALSPDFIRAMIERGESVYVRLWRGTDTSQQKNMISSFKVPWKTRINSKMFATHQNSSILDPWGSASVRPQKDQLGKQAPSVFLCTPGLDSAMSRKSLAVYLEFVQHHVNIGVNHIVLTVTYAWDSPEMAFLLRSMQSFIDQGLVTVTSHAIDGRSFLYSTGNISWHRDNVKVFQANICLYMSKGIADYLAIWDIDEFFIPKGRYNRIQDVVSTVDDVSNIDSPETLQRVHAVLEGRERWSPRPGMADDFPHPLCYLEMRSDAIANLPGGVERGVFTGELPSTSTSLPFGTMVSFDERNTRLWLGQRFRHGIEPRTSTIGRKFGFRKGIFPTNRTLLVGLHMSGSCQLPPPWNGCRGDRKDSQLSDMCYSPDPFQSSLNKTRPSRHRVHFVDQMIYPGDARRVDPDAEAVLFHFLEYRFYWEVSDEALLEVTNDYASKYFNATLKGLRERSLDFLIETPEDTAKLPQASEEWLDYNSVYANRYSRTKELRNVFISKN